MAYLQPSSSLGACCASCAQGESCAGSPQQTMGDLSLPWGSMLVLAGLVAYAIYESQTMKNWRQRRRNMRDIARWRSGDLT